MTGTTVSVDATVAAVVREAAGRLTGALTRTLGNLDVAEESVQDALLTVLERWPREGSHSARGRGWPPWLVTAPSTGCGATPATATGWPSSRAGGRPRRPTTGCG